MIGPTLPAPAAGERTSDHTWRRDFTLLWGGTAASQLSTMCTTTAGPLLALALTGSPFYAGWVMAAGTLPSLLMHIPAGIIVDRFDRHRIMLCSQLARLCAAAALVCALVLLKDPPPSLLILAAFTDGTFSTFYNTAEFTAIRRLIPHDDLSGAMAKNESRGHFALLAGRPLGGLLYGLGHALPFAVNVISCVFSVFTLGRMRTRDLGPKTGTDPARTGSLLRELGEGLGWLRRDAYLRTVLIVCAITNFSFQTIFLLLVVRAEEQHVPGAVIGVLLAASGVGGALGSLAAPRILRRLTPPAVVVSSVCFWITLPLTVLVTDRPFAGVFIWTGVSFMGANMNVALAVYLATEVPERLMGRVTSVSGFLTRGAVPIGALFGGYVLTHLDTRLAIQIIFGIVVLLAIVVSVDRPRSRPERPGVVPTP